VQPVDFEYTSIKTRGRPNLENIQSGNVMFPANTSLFALCCVICFNLVLHLARDLDYAVLFPILVLIYSLFYFFVVRSFQAEISIDEKGVHFKSFRLSDFTLDYRDIKSVIPNKIVKPSFILIAIMLLILLAMLTYSAISGDWKLIVSIVLLLPWYMLVKHKQDRKYHDLDTQLYIEHKNKKWYEPTPYYSLVTDGITASAIEAVIAHYREAE
jgi:small-conductance mechanosensitive channel